MGWQGGGLLGSPVLWVELGQPLPGTTFLWPLFSHLKCGGDGVGDFQGGSGSLWVSECSLQMEVLN